MLTVGAKRDTNKPGPLKRTLTNDIENLVENSKSFVDFVETKNGEDAVVEGLISLWKINASGSLYKYKEVSFDLKQEFDP